MQSKVIQFNECYRCEYGWLPRTMARPHVCPRCKRRDWDKKAIKERPSAQKKSPAYMKRKNWLTK